MRLGLHLVDTSSREISVRDERDSLPSAVWQEQSGLISKGEFGSTLGMILADTVKGKVAWSHWEQIAGDPAAVFQYSVPRSASNYEVIGYQQQAAEEYANLRGGQGVAGIGSQLSGPSSKILPTITRPGYHGSLWLDPATGTILRITIEAEAKDGSPFQRAAILVQYGPVQIGDSTFICPVRSLALLRSSVAQGMSQAMCQAQHGLYFVATTHALWHDWSRIAPGVVLGTGLFAIYGLGLGALLKNQVVGIVVGLGFTLVVETIVAAIWPTIGEYLPGLAATALEDAARSSFESANTQLLPWWGGAVMLVVYGVALSVVGTSTTLRSDIT